MANAITSAFELHDAGAVIDVTHVVHVASLAHALSCEQHDAVRHESQVGSLVPKPQVWPPLELDVELAAVVAAAVVAVVGPVVVVLELLPPQARG